ncbi:MAG: hypothetical protein ABL908_21905 [Hyphomicrobium sp.]
MRRIAVALAIVLLAAPSPAAAQSPSLEGNWTGGGYAEAISGHRERVSCRVRYTRETADVFGVHAVCASQSVKLVQTGTVSRAGANRFAGDFYNAEFDVAGRVRVVLEARLRHVVSGSRQTVTLSSGRGSGTLSLSRK